jgi:hypothetical protein
MNIVVVWKTTCSFGYKVIAGADLFREKSIIGWWLVAGTAGWWLINQTNRAM